MNLWRNEDWRRRITLREIELMKDTATRDHASICVTHVFWRALPALWAGRPPALLFLFGGIAGRG
jgi:hypothetical protein